MLFFGILNIPIFKYLCELPTLKETFFICKPILLFDFRIELSNYNYILYNSYNIIYNYVVYYYIKTLEFNYVMYSDYLYSNSEMLNFKIFEIIFFTNSTNISLIEFISLQNFIFIICNEPHLVFFRIYNMIPHYIYGISVYLISPVEFILYFNKIQCFCFEELLIFPGETIDLPVIFYITEEIEYYYYILNKIVISYLFLLKNESN